jgi:hypothetical protein
MRAVAGFAVLSVTGALLTQLWVPFAVFFVVVTATPELAARLHHRHFYGRGVHKS